MLVLLVSIKGRRRAKEGSVNYFRQTKPNHIYSCSLSALAKLSHIVDESEAQNNRKEELYIRN